jgi:hypothetical protein
LDMEEIGRASHTLIDVAEKVTFGDHLPPEERDDEMAVLRASPPVESKVIREHKTVRRSPDQHRTAAPDTQPSCRKNAMHVTLSGDVTM